MFDYYPEGWIIDTPENRAALQNISALNDACRDGQILEGRALICDSSHNLLVDLGCMKGIIPHDEGALGIREGTVRDIAIISRVNRPVCFMITNFQKDSEGHLTALLSRRAAQEKCMEEYVKKLTPGDIINARITHLESFGAFADIGCGIIALLPIDAISVSRIDHPRERFTVGMDVKVIIKSIENGRITLSHKELLGTWAENVAMFKAGETVAGIVRSVEPYGIFVELSPNLAGLAEAKEDVVPGQQASVYIKSIISSRMKVKLVIIDTFDYSYRPAAPKYFYSGNRIDRFVYSPPDSEKEIVTEFAAK
ncbi:MAG: 30S ribosomal protein S1 [Eubacteriales bacterium]|jgi:small subunit ribosomal protein S1